MPDIGEGTKEVTITEWHVKVGDIVKEFDLLCEVKSDKAVAEITSKYDGIIRRIYHEADATVDVGKPLVDIEVDAVGAVAIPERVPEVATSKTIQEEKALDPTVLTLPSVRRLAKENNIDLSRVTASGKHGRILKEDLLNYLESGNSERPKSIEDNQQRHRTEQKAGFVETKELETIIPLRGIQKAMIKTMTEALKIPHFHYADEIDMTKLIKFNRELRELLNSKTNKPDSVVSTNLNSNLAFIIKMVSLALLEYPQLNATFDSQELQLVQKNYHNIGVAVDTKAGLLVPNIKNVQQLNVDKINSELLRLRDLGYRSKLGVEDLSRGTITLSNIGAIGGTFGVPVILPPEILIGALGRIRKLEKFNGTAMEASYVMQLVWSADHRVVDGATLSRFTNLLKLYLEEPINALTKLA